LPVDQTRAIKSFDSWSEFIFIWTEPCVFQILLLRVSYSPTLGVVSSITRQRNKIKLIGSAIVQFFRARWKLSTKYGKVAQRFWSALNFLCSAQSSSSGCCLFLSQRPHFLNVCKFNLIDISFANHGAISVFNFVFEEQLLL